MVEILDKHNCCGCGFCASICPKRCISMEADKEGFLYPKVDKDGCIQCGLCEKGCNELHPLPEVTPRKVIAAFNTDETIRLMSSSGGIFYSLAMSVIERGGVVFGARFDKDWQVVIDYTETQDGIKAFMGSKYVQARVEEAYINVKRFLGEGRLVLFSGTPCQVAGLHHYIGKATDKLLTVDFVCHGVPSPKAWSKYLHDVVKSVNCIENVSFRDKIVGWKNFSFKTDYSKDGEKVIIQSTFRDNPYLQAFLKDIILRPSCYNCKVKCGSSRSDITLADFWGVQYVLPDMDDDKGTSVVILNTQKGEEIIKKTTLNTKEISIDVVKKYNEAYITSSKPHPKRDYFFSHLDSINFINLTEKCMRPSFRQSILRYYNGMKRRIEIVITGGQLK